MKQNHGLCNNAIWSICLNKTGFGSSMLTSTNNRKNNDDHNNLIINSYRRTYASTLYHIYLPEDIRLNLIPYTLTGGHTPQPYTIYTYRRTYASTLYHIHLRRTYASTLYHIHLPEDIRFNLIPYTLTGGHTPQPYTIYTYGGHTPQPYTIYTYRRT